MKAVAARLPVRLVRHIVETDAVVPHVFGRKVIVVCTGIVAGASAHNAAAALAAGANMVGRVLVVVADRRSAAVAVARLVVLQTAVFRSIDSNREG
jgi:hypothetical protein